MGPLAVAASSVSLAATLVLLLARSTAEAGDAPLVAAAGPRGRGHATLHNDELSALVLPFGALVLWTGAQLARRLESSGERLAERAEAAAALLDGQLTTAGHQFEARVAREARRAFGRAARPRRSPRKGVGSAPYSPA